MSPHLVLTFADADLLIAASREDLDLHDAAVAILSDPFRIFAASSLLRLEVLPKPDHHRFKSQLAFLETYFASCIAWATIDEPLIRRAEVRARRHGLSALDALHLEAAITLGAAEFVTAERPTSPLFRETNLRVSTIRPAGL